MAEREDIARLGIKRTEQWWCDEFRGTAEALIEAGLIRADQLPGTPGVNKTMRSFAADGAERRNGQNGWRSPGARQVVKSGRKFRVMVNLDEAEEKRRLAEFDARLKAEAEQREREFRIREKTEQAEAAGMTLEQWVLRGTPSSEQDFRSREISMIDTFEHMMDNRGGYGYALEHASRARLGMLFEAMRSLIERAPIVLDPARREADIDELFEFAGVPRNLAESRPQSRPTLRVVK
jgi:hypothetical protein